MEQINWAVAIKSARLYRGLTQLEVARKSKGKLKEARLARIETNRQVPTEEDLKILTLVLGISQDRLRVLAEPPVNVFTPRKPDRRVR